MGKSIAFYSITEKSALLTEVAGVLKKYRVPFFLSPHASRRDALLWAGALNSASVSVCVVLEEEQGESAVSVSQIIPPDIPLVIVPRIGVDTGKLMELLGNTVALVIPPGNIQRLYRVLTWFAGSAAARFTKPGTSELIHEPIDWSDGMDFHHERQISQKNFRKASSQTSDSPADSSNDDDTEDRFQLDRLEKLMESATRIREEEKENTPVVLPHPSGLDFSVPLRKIMSQAWTVAKTAGNTEVLGIHYLVAAYDTGYADLLQKVGIRRENLDGFLSEFDSLPDKNQEPVMSEEGFEAVSHAKEIVKLKGEDLVRATDFLQAVLSASTGSVRTFLETYNVDQQSAVSVLADYNQPEERDKGFFKPTERDQAEFVEFNTDDVVRVQNQLENIRGFHEAALSSHNDKNQKFDNSLISDESAGRVVKIPKKPKVVTYTGEFPPIDTMEEAADFLLEGQIIAYASDLYFALAVDASNPKAVEKLREAAELTSDDPLGIQIHSTSLLKHLTIQKSEKLDRLFEVYWPGPLAVVLKKSAGVLGAVSRDETFAVRIPSDNLSLGVLSMFGRPLAVTSVNLSGGIQPTTELVTQYLTGKIAMVIQGEQEVINKESTIISAVEEPWQIIRSGNMTEDSLRQLLNEEDFKN